MKKIYSIVFLIVRKVGKGMKCSHCGKEIADISFSFKLGERYYHNELCYFESVKKDFNKTLTKEDEMLLIHCLYEKLVEFWEENNKI